MSHRESALRPHASIASLILISTLLVLIAGLATGCGQESRSERAVRSELKRQLGQRLRLFGRPTLDADDIQPLVRRFYRGRKFRPAWTDGRGPSRDASALIQALGDAPREGLDPAAYPPERIDSLMKITSAGLIGPPPSARALAALDLRLTRAFLGYATHLSTGQVDPKALPSDWHVSRPRFDPVPLLTQAIQHHRVRATLQGLAPRDPHYARLRLALARYREIEAAGGWVKVASGTPLRRGQRGPRVVALRERLVAGGDLSPTASHGAVFDFATEKAVRSFQERHGLETDGVVGAGDFEALNAPVARRVRQIELNMERWRWIPALEERYIMVNIPDFTLEVVEGGRPRLASRVVVGKQFNRTPIFSDQITSLVVNPYWNVPPRIAADEVLAQAQEDPTYLERIGMHVFDSPEPDARELDPGSVGWAWVSPENLHYSFRQEPGPQNPIGRVKFMCPNQFDVYLHDTPAEHLFKASERDLSHGCVRVERAVDLAEYLLRGKEHSSRKDLLEAFASPALDSAVRLPRPIPVHLFYWTAWVDDQGRVQFRDDVYGLDHVLDRALSRRGTIAWIGPTAQRSPAALAAAVP